MNVVPMRPGSEWVRDSRGEGRALRVSAHAEEGLITLSSWRADSCSAAVRLSPQEAGELISLLAGALAALTTAQDFARTDAAPAQQISAS